MKCLGAQFAKISVEKLVRKQVLPDFTQHLTTSAGVRILCVVSITNVQWNMNMEEFSKPNFEFYPRLATFNQSLTFFVSRQTASRGKYVSA